MKFLLNYISGMALLLLASCSKHIDLVPQDQIVTGDYWKKPDDIKLFANQFYAAIPSHALYSGGLFWTDNNSDNMIPATPNTRLAGLNNLTTSNNNWYSTGLQGWDYTRIRSVNYALGNFHNVTGNQTQINTYAGELFFFRAYFYFHIVKTYGDVPWVGRLIPIENEEEVYAGKTVRTVVVDSLLKDLDSAIAYLPVKPQAEVNRLNKEVALLFKSRVALYEGTWQKHHTGTEFATEGADWQRYLRTAAETAKTLMDLGTAALYTTGDPQEYYRTLFAAFDMSANPEVLLWRKYDGNLGQAHSVAYNLRNSGSTGVTKSLVDNYLCADGLPISVSPLYKGDHTLANTISDRDSRLLQTIWIPGDPLTFDGATNQVTEYFTVSWLVRSEAGYKNTSGYQLKKGMPATFPGTGHNQTEGALIFRFAEALLNYAEAKAELDELTQEDVDISINKLRDRASMPDLNIAAITTDPNWAFPAESPIINEIRRERRSELAAEGFRFDDLARWAAVDILTGKRPRGAYFVQSDYPELTPGQNIYVDAEGYVDPFQVALPNGYAFNLDRDYLIPVPQTELTLNPKLGQNPGW